MKYFLVAMLMCMVPLFSFAQLYCSGTSPSDAKDCRYYVHLTYYEDTGEIVDCQVIKKVCKGSLEYDYGGGSGVVMDAVPLDRPNCQFKHNIVFKEHDPDGFILTLDDAEPNISENFSCQGYVECESWMTSKTYSYAAAARRIRNEVCRVGEIYYATSKVIDKGSNASIHRSRLKSQYIFAIQSRITAGFSIGLGSWSVPLFTNNRFVEEKPVRYSVLPVGCRPPGKGDYEDQNYFRH
jgi:hypothetical protein